MPTFGQRLKELREAENITQEEFGKIFNMSKTAISLYEGDKRFPDQDLLKAFRKYFDVTLDYLVGISNNSPTNDIKAPFNEKKITTKENLDLIRGKYIEDKKPRLSIYSDEDLDNFIFDINNEKYLRLAKNLKERGISPEDILSFTLKNTIEFKNA